MSRVGKLPVNLPKGVDVVLSDSEIAVKAGAVTLRRPVHPLVQVTRDGDVLRVKNVAESAESQAMSGTMRALLANMVEGVAKGFEKKLTLVGVGFRAQAQGTKLNLQVGFSHPVVREMPEGIKVADRQAVGQVAAEIRAIRPPEPYKGKGIRYANERVELKETKKK